MRQYLFTTCFTEFCDVAVLYIFDGERLLAILGDVVALCVYVLKTVRETW